MYISAVHPTHPKPYRTVPYRTVPYLTSPHLTCACATFTNALIPKPSSFPPPLNSSTSGALLPNSTSTTILASLVHRARQIAKHREEMAYTCGPTMLAHDRRGNIFNHEPLLSLLRPRQRFQSSSKASAMLGSNFTAVISTHVLISLTRQRQIFVPCSLAKSHVGFTALPLYH
jgi:hypothetical protein